MMFNSAATRFLQEGWNVIVDLVAVPVPEVDLIRVVEVLGSHVGPLSMLSRSASWCRRSRIRGGKSLKAC